MSSVFEAWTDCNPNITQWDVSQVTNFVSLVFSIHKHTTFIIHALKFIIFLFAISVLMFLNTLTNNSMECSVKQPVSILTLVDGT